LPPETEAFSAAAWLSVPPRTEAKSPVFAGLVQEALMEGVPLPARFEQPPRRVESPVLILLE
jgi:hypothetical protein